MKKTGGRTGNNRVHTLEFNESFKSSDFNLAIQENDGDEDDDDGPPGLEEDSNTIMNQDFNYNQNLNNAQKSQSDLKFGGKGQIIKPIDIMKNQKKNSDINPSHSRQFSLEDSNLSNKNDNYGFSISQNASNSNSGQISSLQIMGKDGRFIQKVEEVQIEYQDVEKLNNVDDNYIQSSDEEYEQNQRGLKENNIRQDEKKQYQDICGYIDKINQSIRISNRKIDQVPELLKGKRMIKEQIRQLEKELQYNIQVLKKIEGNKQKNIPGELEDQRELSVLELNNHLKERINDKRETLKFMDDNEALIEENNNQSLICFKMGKTLVDFHYIIQNELNQLKHYSKTLPSKQEIDSKEEVRKLKEQQKQETEKRIQLEGELSKKIIDFQQLFCDSQEAKKIIRQQLIEIKDQKEKLKLQNDDLDRRQKEFKKQQQQQQIKEGQKDHQKDFNDNESKRSDRTSHTQTATLFKHKIAMAKNQHARITGGDDDMPYNMMIGSDKRKSRFDEQNRNNFMGQEETDDMYFTQNSDFFNNQNDQTGRQDNQIQLLQSQNLNQFGMKQIAPSSQNPFNDPTSSPKNSYLSENQSSLQKSQQQQQPQLNPESQMDDSSPNIKISGLKGISKSALKKKIGDNQNEDEGKQNSNINLGLFDFNVIVDEPKNLSSSLSSKKPQYQTNKYNTSSTSKKQQSYVSGKINFSQIPTVSPFSTNNTNQQTPQTLRGMMEQIQSEQSNLIKEISGFKTSSIR